MSSQEKRRQSIGKSLSADRLAIGQRIRSDLSRSLMPERKQKMLQPLPPKGALPVQIGVGEWRGGGESSSPGGGIASPLTEASAVAREYWPAGLASSDGLFVLPAIKTLSLTDANGAAVIVELANPAGGA